MRTPRHRHEAHPMSAAIAHPIAPPHDEPDLPLAALRSAALFRDATDDVLARLVADRLVHRIELARDTLVEIPPGVQRALCLVISGQIAIGVFDPTALAGRGRQRDAALGEKDGTLMPPGPLARA